MPLALFWEIIADLRPRAQPILCKQYQNMVVFEAFT